MRVVKSMKESERQRAILQKLVRMESDRPRAGLIATGFPALDGALGGGVPRGRIVEFFGPSGSGKTTLALQCIAHMQSQHMNAAFIDADQTFDAAYAAGLGVAIERL